MNILEIKHFSKSFGDLQVLRDISFSVAEGEVVSIIGSSGGGKSTLLRCATLLETVDRGSMRYRKIKVVTDGVYARKPFLKAARNYFGLVFQNFNLFPHYTVSRNITDAPLSVQKRSRIGVWRRAFRLLDKMGLLSRRNAYPCQLSGGQQQRVSIVRALMMNHRILFFDEPTSALDPELTREVLKVIRHIAEEKMTMVIVTHEIEFARAVSDRIVFMADGVIVEEGDAKEVIDHPKNERTRVFLATFAAAK